MATDRLPWIALVAPALVAGGALAACSQPESPTELAPEGPPMVREVFLQESIPNCPDTNPNCGVYRATTALAYGTHPDAVEAGIKHNVTTAVPLTGQRIRIVMDELLVGNYLEEIACNSIVDDDQYSAVPEGATPEDVAKCATPPDVLVTSCVGEHAVCIGPDGPVGVLDEDDDGASDDTQFIRGAVGLSCADGTITPEIDLQATYWQPSGNQQVPAQGGLLALGPAITLVATHGLPTNTTCKVVFSDQVVDKSGINVCGPQWGDAGAPDELDVWPPDVACDPGDTAAVSFGVETLRKTGGSPAEGGTGFPKIKSGQTYAELSLSFNAEMDPTSFAGLTLAPAPAGAVTTLLQSGTVKTVLVRVEGGLAPTTAYTLTVPAATDYYGQPFATPIVIHFTTGA